MVSSSSFFFAGGGGGGVGKLSRVLPEVLFKSIYMSI